VADFSELGRSPSIALYLPQFHPIPENDQAWGTGFTEWRNVVRARPLFRGHTQPNIPADLGFYDLRLSETRAAQAELARRYAIDAFCYYHYWFSGRRLLGYPFDAVRASDEPDFPFCLCWTNEAWRANWDGRSGTVLVDQAHSDADDLEHIRWLLPVFADDRYVRIDGKPLFIVYRANLLPAPAKTTDTWRKEADRAGVGDLYLCRVESFVDERDDPRSLGFDAAIEFQPDWAALPSRLAGFGPHSVYDYGRLAERALAKSQPKWRRFPCITPRWDNTPRNPQGALVFAASSPERYRAWLSSIAARTSDGDPIFINAWNEWGEGAYLEPDMASGHAYLQAHSDAMNNPHAYAGSLPACPSPPNVLDRLMTRFGA